MCIASPHDWSSKMRGLHALSRRAPVRCPASLIHKCICICTLDSDARTRARKPHAGQRLESEKVDCPSSMLRTSHSPPVGTTEPTRVIITPGLSQDCDWESSSGSYRSLGRPSCGPIVFWLHHRSPPGPPRACALCRCLPRRDTRWQFILGDLISTGFQF